MYKIYKLILLERGTLLEPVVDFILNLKTVTYKQLVDNMPFNVATITSILKYLIQIRVVEYNIYQNVMYYTINTKYILNRLFLPFYMDLLSEKEQNMLIELFVKGVAIRRNDEDEAMLFVKSVPLHEIKSLLRLKFREYGTRKEEKMKNIEISKRKKTRKYLTLDFEYLEKKLLNKIVNDYILERYIDVRCENILKYIENDKITLDQQNGVAKKIICTVNSNNFAVNTTVLKRWIINKHLDMDTRKLYNFIVEKLFVPDDQIIKQVLVERQKIKPILFGLMQNGLIAIHKNGWVDKISFGGVAHALMQNMEHHISKIAEARSENLDSTALSSNLIDMSRDLFVLKGFRWD